MSTTFADFLRTAISFDRITFRPAKFASLVRLIWQVRRERKRLATLSRSELDEMGIHPIEALREAERGLFDLPKSRLGKL